MMPSDVLVSSPVIRGEDAATNVVGGAAGETFAEYGGVDPSMDPELALVSSSFDTDLLILSIILIRLCGYRWKKNGHVRRQHNKKRPKKAQIRMLHKRHRPTPAKRIRMKEIIL